ncbi:hypothetical protein [Kribbella sp. NPDC051770]|uniref:hypothetical protein n=1 Tax=Kribbella sp. NPDC051770 TaxID=3155413 RepID=UPI00342F7D1C
MNQRRWVALLIVAIVLSLAGGVLQLLDGRWLSSLPTLLSASIGLVLLQRIRRPDWTPPRRIPRWRLVVFWALILATSAAFAVAAAVSSHTSRRWIAAVLVLVLLAIGVAFTALVRSANSTAGRTE